MMSESESERETDRERKRKQMDRDRTMDLDFEEEERAKKAAFERRSRLSRTPPEIAREVANRTVLQLGAGLSNLMNAMRENVNKAYGGEGKESELESMGGGEDVASDRRRSTGRRTIGTTEAEEKQRREQIEEEERERQRHNMDINISKALQNTITTKFTVHREKEESGATGVREVRPQGLEEQDKLEELIIKIKTGLKNILIATTKYSEIGMKISFNKAEQATVKKNVDEISAVLNDWGEKSRRQREAERREMGRVNHYKDRMERAEMATQENAAIWEELRNIRKEIADVKKQGRGRNTEVSTNKKTTETGQTKRQEKRETNRNNKGRNSVYERTYVDVDTDITEKNTENNDTEYTETETDRGREYDTEYSTVQNRRNEGNKKGKGKRRPMQPLRLYQKKE